MMGAWFFAVSMTSTGLVTLLLGYLIKARRMAGLIAGYDPRQVKDARGLTDWVGLNVSLIGGLVVLYGFVPMLLQAGLWMHLGFALLLLILIVRTAYGARRY